MEIAWNLQEENYDEIIEIPIEDWKKEAHAIIDEYIDYCEGGIYRIDRGGKNGTKSTHAKFRIDLQGYIQNQTYANFQVQINKAALATLNGRPLKKTSVACVLIPTNVDIPSEKVRKAFKTSCFELPKRKVTITRN